MFVDSVTITIKAGDGGVGSAHFRRDGQTAKGGPDGGNGGNGGNIYFQASRHVVDLREFRFKKKIVAEPGIAGSRQNMYGANAPHMTVFVPIGTEVTDVDAGWTLELVDTEKPVLVAKGGKGGRGNNEFKTATNQTPEYAEPGVPGEAKTIHLELRIIAQIGLIGLPNAGKSSLLAVLTNAKPAIADYPFTTLEPNIGMMGKYAIADIPGLIEGASTGKGLGTKFLKHIEKTKILVHCIDSSVEDVEQSYQVVRDEFEKFNPELTKKPELILLTKTDLVEPEVVKKSMTAFKKTHKTVLSCSIYDDESIEKLQKSLISFVK